MKVHRSAIWIAVAACTTASCGGTIRTPDAWAGDTRVMLDARTEVIRSCYAKAVASGADLQGTVTVRFLVENETGLVRRVAIDDGRSTATDELRRCVVGNLNELQLAPADQNDGDATFTWRFSLSDGPAATPDT
jgi:hypothetical protein